MTKSRSQDTEGAIHKPKVVDPIDALYDGVVRELQSLAEDGLVDDTGRKRWCKRTGRYEIVWVLTELGERIGKIEAPSTLEHYSRPRRLN
jgi:hypothetical protein